MSEADKLDAVYAATSGAEIARTYDAWAATYDAEMAALGYRHPTICLAFLARHLPPGGPVLDAGAGTDLLGEWLRLAGYAPVEAVDLSPGMLAAAAAKGAYDRLAEGDLTRRLPFEDARYTGAVCSGDSAMPPGNRWRSSADTYCSTSGTSHQYSAASPNPQNSSISSGRIQNPRPCKAASRRRRSQPMTGR